MPSTVPFHMPPPQDAGYGAYTGGDDEAKGFDFNDESIRKAFIRKVYSILMVSLTVDDDLDGVDLCLLFYLFSVNCC